MHFTVYGLDFQEVSSDFFQIQLCPHHFGTVSHPIVRIGYLIMFFQKAISIIPSLVVFSICPLIMFFVSFF